jgi:leader peptidase (prepilin peptidase)/N-methyltransferase
MLSFDNTGWQGYVLSGIILVLVYYIGATVFSYLNIVIEELPKEDEELPLKTRLTKGRSMCPHCGHQWKWTESLPIISWLKHKHKCAYCFEYINARHTLIEVLGGVLALVSVLYYNVSIQSLTVFIVFAILAAITFIDMDTQYIPPELNILLAVVGVISIWTLPGASIVQRIIGVFVISLPLILIVLVVPDGFGGGDIKLMAAAGVLLGWKGNVIAFFIGLVLGGIYGIYLLSTRKKGKKEHFAFGPFLSIGIAVSMYAGTGEYLMNQYIGIIMRMMNQ